MSYLATLAQRTLGVGPTIQPLLPAAFAPVGQAILDEPVPEVAAASIAPRPLITPNVNQRITTQGPERRIDTPARPAPVAVPRIAPYEVARRTDVSIETPVTGASQRIAVAEGMRDNSLPDKPVTEPPDWWNAAREPTLLPAKTPSPLPETQPRREPVPQLVGHSPAPAPASSKPGESASQVLGPAPTIHVRIGRIDVRAAPAPASAAPPPARPAAKRTSLEDYLRGGSGGGR